MKKKKSSRSSALHQTAENRGFAKNRKTAKIAKKSSLGTPKMTIKTGISRLFCILGRKNAGKFTTASIPPSMGHHLLP